MKQIIILDTIGNRAAIHEGYFRRLPFVHKWGFHSPPSQAGKTRQHEHGGMVAEKALLPLWNDPAGVACHFVQAFDDRGDFDMDRAWAFDVIREIAGAGPAWMNCSWGAYGQGAASMPDRIEATAWREFLVEMSGRVRATWAAGNFGNYDPADQDNEFPASLLSDLSDKIGSADRDGTPSDYSGDSTLAPPAGVYWATDVALLNPSTGAYDRGSGTSFAAPKHSGTIAALGILEQTAAELLVESAVRPALVPAKSLPNPKWGWGWLEAFYQELVKDCPFMMDDIRNAERHATRLSTAGARWHDFERKT